MRKKFMILLLAGIITVSSMSLAYAANRDNTTSPDKFNGQMMEMMGYGTQSNDNFNKMIELMKQNGFADEANAMENREFDTMKNLMDNLSDDDYNKMIDVMKNNGYESMANMMKSVDKENMKKFHQSMMGN